MKMVLTARGALALAATLALPQAARAQDPVATARRVYATASLAAEEYAVGVVGGKVVSVAEVEEARLFIGEARKAARALPAALHSSTDSLLAVMAGLVQRTAPPGALDQVTRTLGERLAGAVGASLEPVPEWAPSLTRGRELYAQACASCHGVTGGGDGLAAAGQDPPPARLADAELLAGTSPLDFYRRVTLGVAGTSMPAFEGSLSEDDRWAVALYASTLRLPPARGTPPQGLAEFPATATRTDLELLAALGHEGPPDTRMLGRVAAIRHAGAASEAARMAAAFRRVRAQLGEAVEQGVAGEAELAGSTALAAYMTFEGLERGLRPRDAGLASELEQAFTGFRLDAQGARSAGELRVAEARLVTLLDRAERVLGAERRPFDLFLQSFILLVREGLEAILIVGALLAFLARIGASRRARDVKAGIVAAIGASLLTALLIETVFHLSPASQEALEGATMLIASGVLFSVSYWLLTKLEVARWTAFVRGKVQEAVAGGSALALASVAFLAVYREGFETVLFYKALFVSGGGGASTGPILAGMAAGSVVLVVLYVAIQRFGVRLPLKPFFAVTSAFLYWMAFTFAGHGIAELQAGGYVGTTVVPWLPRIPRLGIYPTIETTLAQAVLVLLALGALLWVFVLEPHRLGVTAELVPDDGMMARANPARPAGDPALEGAAGAAGAAGFAPPANGREEGRALDREVVRSLERMDADLAEIRSEIARLRERLSRSAAIAERSR
jgi:high-affinity iron transporter